MLDRHNEIRSDVARGLVGDEPTATDMVKLDWDEDLALVAQNWVDRCIWGHNANRTSEYGALVGGNTYVGENLAVDFRHTFAGFEAAKRRFETRGIPGRDIVKPISA